MRRLAFVDLVPTLTLRDGEPHISASLRAYLEAFDMHVRALIHGDEPRARASRVLMTVFLTGALPEKGAETRSAGSQRPRCDLGALAL